MSSPPTNYRSRAVRALVLLHDENLRRFLHVWKQARAASVIPPVTEDPAYTSLDALLRHVFGAARGYMTWMCEVLELPDPEIRIPPHAAVLAAEADSYMEHVLSDGARLCRMSAMIGWRRRVSVAIANAILHRRDVGTRGHASHSARVPRTDEELTNGLCRSR